MFPKRATGRLRPPSPEQVAAYAARHELTLDDDAAQFMAGAVAAGLAVFDRIEELDVPRVPTRHHHRDAGRQPHVGEDPFNAVVRFCEIRGAGEGLLAGREVAVKDCIAIAGLPMTNGGRRVPQIVPSEDAVVVERLLDAGATIVAKTNMEDMALGHGEASYFGAARNPHDPRFSTGGSSSGSAAAVASGLVELALGTDNAGSVRIPAAWCGLVGMKATHGLVPTYGTAHMDHTYDHVGPITRTVEDSALMLEVLAGGDWRDPQWVRADPVGGAYRSAAGRGIEGLRIGVVEEALEPIGCEPAVLETFAAAEARLRALGATIERVSIPLWGDAWPIECATVFPGIHAMAASGGLGTGHLGRADADVVVANAAQARLGAADLPFVQQFMLVTVEHLRERYLGGVFAKGQNLRLELRRQVSAALENVDLLITPTVPTQPFELLDGPASDEEMAMRGAGPSIANACPLNVTGHPALSLPCGADANGLPIGLQVIGRHFDEMRVYQAAFAFEDGSAAGSA